MTHRIPIPAKLFLSIPLNGFALWLYNAVFAFVVLLSIPLNGFVRSRWETGLDISRLSIPLNGFLTASDYNIISLDLSVAFQFH